MQQQTKRQTDCIRILNQTKDGTKLLANELLTLEHVLNGRRLTEYGEQEWERIRAKYLSEDGLGD